MRHKLFWETEDDAEIEELKEKLKKSKEQSTWIRNQNRVFVIHHFVKNPHEQFL